MKSMLRRRPFTPVRWSLRAAIGCATLVATDPAPLWAQTPTLPSDDPRVRTALQVLRDDNAWTMDQQVSLCEIPAPPFGEARRAAEYRRRLTALGLRNVRIDAEGNAIGERPGTGGSPGAAYLRTTLHQPFFPDLWRVRSDL